MNIANCPRSGRCLERRLSGADPGKFDRVIGARLPRREDARLVRGAACYVGDIKVPGCLDAAFVRSHLAHGEIRGIDLEPASLLPGVAAAWSHTDLPFLPDTPPMLVPDSVDGRPWPPLASQRVRYVGEPLAIVVADDRYVAEDAVDATHADIRPLPILLDPTESAGSDVQLFPGIDNVALQRDFGEAIPKSLWLDAAVVVEAHYRQQLLAHTYLEPKAILVRGPRGRHQHRPHQPVSWRRPAGSRLGDRADRRAAGPSPRYGPGRAAAP